MVVKALEKDLGMTLLHRNAKGVSLTDDGERIYVYAQNILKNAELITLAGQQKSRQQFSVAANPSTYLKELYTEYIYEKKTDGGCFFYREGGVEQVMSMVEVGDVELGFLFVPMEKKTAFTSLIAHKKLTFLPLARSRLTLCAGKKSPLYGQSSIPVSLLSELQYVQLEGDYFTTEVLPNAAAQNIVTTNSSDMVLRLLHETDLCNLGGSWAKSSKVKRDISQIRIEGCGEEILFGCLHRKQEVLSRYAEEFLHRLQQVSVGEHTDLRANL